MRRVSKRVAFDNGRGQQLGGIMEWPAVEPHAFAVFSHCFTCTKDLKATVRISRRLAHHGICVLRYDFTGLADSQGDFGESNFTTNCLDLRAAAQFLADQYCPPQILVGHSLGGTATAVTADLIDSVVAVATIASPGSTHRLAGYLDQANPDIAATGSGMVNIGGFDFTLKQQLLDDLRSYDIESELGKLTLPILMFHSPADQTVPYGWGLKMFDAVRSPKSFVTLTDADHLLVSHPQDVNYVADLIHQWSAPYLA